MGVTPQPITRTIALMSPRENVVASGPFRRDHFGLAGDGSYSALKPSRKSSAITKGFAMIHNEVKRQGSKRASTPMWRPLDNGVINLSMEALYLQSDQGVLPWAYDGTDYAHMISRSVLEFGGTADSRNRVQYRITSAWSELALVLWSLARKIPHPQLLILFPEQWQARVQARGLKMPHIGA